MRKLLVRKVGLEPTRGCPHWNLKAARALVLLCIACVGVATTLHAHGRKPNPSHEPSHDEQNPAYWGLKNGEYIPRPGCFVWWRKAYAVEICSQITYL
jgi:hypothetical protein